MRKEFYLLLAGIISMFTLPAHTQITNTGVLKINSGTNVVFTTDYHNTSTGTHINEGDLHLKGDFTNDGTVTATTSGTTYFDSTTDVRQELNGTNTTIDFYNMVVNNTAPANDGVAVASGFDLTVANQLDMLSGKLRLMGDAMLVQDHTGVSTNTGTSHLLVDQDGASNAYRYNYWSSPVHGSSGTYRVQDVLMDGTTPDQFHPSLVQYTNNYEGDDTTTPITLSAYWFWKFIDGTVNAYNEQDWVQLFDLTTTPPSPSPDADINPAEGYIMKGPNATAVYADRQNYTFEGIPNDGEYTLTISANKEYLVGNPYPCALDADQFINDNISGTPVIDGTIYFWEHWSTNTHVYVEYGGGYATYNLSGSAAAATLHSHFTSGSGTGSIVPKRYIPIGQGFVVRSQTTSGGNIVFKNSQRAFVREGANSVQFGPDQTYLNANGVMSRIYLGYVNPTEGHRQITLAFTDGVATHGFDYGYDGIMAQLSDDDMYFTMDDNGHNFPYVIQGTDMFDITDEYPITIKVTNPGLHTIMIDKLENFQFPVYIYDRLQNMTTRIDGEDQQFQILLSPGVYENRFYVVFRSVEQMQTENPVSGTVSVVFDDGEIVINNPENLPIDKLSVFNMIGQKVMELSPNTTESVLSVPFHYGQSTYILLLESDHHTASYKFFNE